jgi:hypothetical protein
LAIRHLFRVKTPLGYFVTLSRDRWRQITRYKHRAVAGKEKAVRTCLQSPSIIRASAKDPSVHLNYLPAGDVHLCVVVAPVDGDERFVVTAYFTRNIKAGVELWKK